MTNLSTVALYLSCAVPAGFFLLLVISVIASPILSSAITHGKVERNLHDDPHQRKHRITTTDAELKRRVA